MEPSFILSLATDIVSDISSQPIQEAIAILRRDMRAMLTASEAKNRVHIVADDTLSSEQYSIAVLPREIQVRCADDLGAVYGLLAISEQFLGIYPLDWWHEIQRPSMPSKEIPQQTITSPAQAVRFRGWFVNDEVLLEGWHQSISDRFAVWKRIFETLLRCHGNMVIAGTDRLHDGDALIDLASSMGLWITQHHAELLGAKMFSRVYPDQTPSYTEHPELFEQLWRDSVHRLNGKKVVWAIGYRGQGDMAFWHSDAAAGTDAATRGAYVGRIMRRQMAIVREQDP